MNPSPVPPELMAAIWREVSKHLDIDESTHGLLRTLQARFHIQALVVRRWEQGRARTVGAAGLPLLPPDLAQPVPNSALREVEAWALGGQVQRWEDRRGWHACLVPAGLEGPVWAGPVLESGALIGVLIGLGQELGEGLQALLEPAGVALANDQRLVELSRLREAAESDRQALLSRLARQDLSELIVGAERGLRAVMQRVAQVAPTDAPVLILGETGSGKEVVARAIHGRSAQAEGPFLKVNCGAIPPELIDSELFGHEKGSFTGAIHQRKGWFERADGGTLFLDEVAELPPAAQVRLLRVLQDGSFHRVGGQEPHTARVRVVAATHRDLKAMVLDGRFRQDLWYRIHVFPIVLPSLRERKEDIPTLVAWFAQRAGVRLFGRPLEVQEAELGALMAYPWPGNVRELAAVVERAAILGNGRSLELQAALGSGASAPALTEREQIEEVLRSCKGRIEGHFGAAQALGVNANTLRSRMRRLGVDWSKYR